MQKLLSSHSQACNLGVSSIFGTVPSISKTYPSSKPEIHTHCGETNQTPSSKQQQQITPLWGSLGRVRIVLLVSPEDRRQNSLSELLFAGSCHINMKVTNTAVLGGLRPGPESLMVGSQEVLLLCLQSGTNCVPLWETGESSNFLKLNMNWGDGSVDKGS